MTAGRRCWRHGAGIWKSAGYGFLIVLAGLQAVDTALLEAVTLMVLPAGSDFGGVLPAMAIGLLCGGGEYD